MAGESVNCPNCGHENPPETRFCGVCGSPLTATCPSCGHANSRDARFCSSCGSPLAEGTAVPPVEVSESALADLPPKDLGELISETFSIYRRNFWPFVVIALVPEITFLVSAYTPRPVALALILVGIVLLVLQAGAFVAGVVGQYASRKVDAVECYRAAWRRALSLIAAFVLILLALLIPAILSIVLIGLPLFFYLVVIWFFVAEAIMVEGKGALEALGRSRELVRGTWWRVFGIGVVFTLMLLGLLIAGLIATDIVGFNSPIVESILATAVSVLLTPIFFIGGTLVYLDLRVRKEGYTLEALASEVAG